LIVDMSIKGKDI